MHELTQLWLQMVTQTYCIEVFQSDYHHLGMIGIGVVAHFIGEHSTHKLFQC
uniref:Uncharacterized protein n=1 Tax=Anguilla anguilla TaxID=7936 RepID=A0A0E9WHN0_ANGAN